MASTSMQVPKENYTILRIKRKRNEEPLDALVVESRRKRSRGAVNVFQFAETVESTAWEDERQKRALESRITTLAREGPKKRQHSESAADIRPTIPLKKERHHVSSRARSRAEERKYKIVPIDRSEPVTRSGRLTAPPKVHAVKDLQKALITVYEAVPSESSTGTPMTLDPEMEKFLPMLRDYLQINDMDTPAAPTKPAESVSAALEDDYVWDVFYSRPADGLELNKLSQNIGTVTGLPEDGVYGSDSDSEEDDEDDEDSNAEDWYKNDYPEEEESSNEDSDGSDAFHDENNYDDDDEVYGERYERMVGNNAHLHL